MKPTKLPNKATTKPKSGYVTTKAHPWAMDTEGMVTQTMCDMVDPDIRLFTETVESHNQALVK